MKLSASVVLYKTPLPLVDRLYRCVQASTEPVFFAIIDNSPEPSIEAAEFSGATYRFTGKNLGYGSAHNLGFEMADDRGSDYHVILNPDISFPPETFRVLTDYMDANPDVGLVMPEIRNQDHELQYLCKLLPTAMDLFGRRFLRKLIPGYVKRRDERLELHSSDYKSAINVPWLSGCFMFLRVAALKQVGGFDSRYFMYAEDIDLSRRIHQKYRTMYFPGIRIVHDHAKESFKSFKMTLVHIKSAIQYFNKWGWFFDKERRSVNKATLDRLRLLSGKSTDS